MHIHFVCTGNAYRSRLAEAYARSINTSKDIKFSSSGIEANNYKKENGPICWYTMLVLKHNGLIPYMSWHQQQTTQKILKDVDLVVCMAKSHLEYCKRMGWKNKSQVWNISDLTDDGTKTDTQYINLAKQTYAMIVEKVDKLLKDLTKDNS